ncbi:MAG: hypothetical protein R3B70_41745 [Polyangiaceae bacterium]
MADYFQLIGVFDLLFVAGGLGMFELLIRVTSGLGILSCSSVDGPGLGMFELLIEGEGAGGAKSARFGSGLLDE